jgi:hypothetical protein
MDLPRWLIVKHAIKGVGVSKTQPDIKLIRYDATGATRQLPYLAFEHLVKNQCKHALLMPRPMTSDECGLAYNLLTMDREDLLDDRDYVSYRALAEFMKLPLKHIITAAQRLPDFNIVHAACGTQGPMFDIDEDINKDLIFTITPYALAGVKRCLTAGDCFELDDEEAEAFAAAIAAPKP